MKVSMVRVFVLSFLIVVFSWSGNAHAKKPAAKAIAKVPPRGSAPVAPGKHEEGDFVIEQKSDGSKVKYKKKTSYDFEGANIDGMYNKPSGSYISNIKDVKAKSIIRIRENFDAEVVDSERLLK